MSNTLEERILEVSKMVSENLIEGALDFRNGAQQTNALENAQTILTPEIQRLSEMLYRVIKKHDISDALINSMRSVEAETGYAIGIAAGLHLAGRTDLIRKFAKVYAEATSDYHPHIYDEDGELIASSH